MLGARDKIDIRLSGTPPDEWPSGISQQGLAQRLEEKVPRVLWAYHTMPQSTTKETPLTLVYGTNAMIPVEI